MTRKRSPAHPIVGLDEAVEMASRLYRADRDHPVDREVAAKNLGYAGLTGRSMGILSTLRQYGLIDVEEDGQIAVSKLAVEALFPESEEEKLSTLRLAAVKPKVFSEVLQRYSGDMPSEANLTSFLVREGYFESAAATVVKTFRSTYEFARLDEDQEKAPCQDGVTEDPLSREGKNPDGPKLESSLSTQVDQERGQGTTAVRQDVFTTDEGDIAVTWPTALSEETYQDIEDWIEILLRKMKRASSASRKPD